MKNQTLQSLAIIYRRMSGGGSDAKFSQLLEDNRAEIAFLAEKFELENEEALLLAACCIYAIENGSNEINIGDISYRLNTSKFEVLLHQDHLKSLVKKKILVESDKEPDYDESTPVVAIMGKGFSLHPSLGKHFE